MHVCLAHVESLKALVSCLSGIEKKKKIPHDACIDGALMTQLVKVKENKETLMFFCRLNILTLKIRTQYTMFLIKNVNLHIEYEEAPVS